MIRHATLDDVPAIVRMGQQFIQTDYRHIVRENPEQMAALATMLIDGEHGTVFLIDRDGDVVGMIGMLCTTHFLSGDMFAGELFWWVNPDQRGNGVRLLKKAEAWALERGAKTIQMIAPNERVGQLYTRMGYMPTEMSFQKDMARP